MQVKRGVRWLVLAAVILVMPTTLPGLHNKRSELTVGLPLLAPRMEASAAQADVAEMLSEEAGIAAYAQASTPVDLQSVKRAFRTIEDETDEYVIGSVPIDGYPETHDVHLFVNTDGWFVAYYLIPDPVAKIVDWIAYQSSQDTITTKLERVLTTVAGVPYSSVAHYDFRYPQATHLMIIGEAGSGDSFTIELPSSFTFYEVSCSAYRGGPATVRIDGADCARGDRFGHGVVAQVAPDTPHTVQVWDWGGLALVYRKE